MANFLLFSLTLTLTLGLLTPLVFSNPEVDILTKFRQGLIDPDNALQSWDSSLVDPCTWFHITCNADNKVIRMDLANYNLAGKLVPELGDLSQLQFLELDRNKFEGTIPTELGKLTNLISFDLYENNFSGGLPSALENLKQLRFVRVNDNKLLSGLVPKGLLGVAVLDITNTGLTKPPASRKLLQSG
uniref:BRASSINOSTEROID INSENSITIVE 1-associated receptor kinase 1-like n=1 Tax=Fragaria vesca subsp. vesca TaxID=101020 RepID=UPI0005CB1C5D|nr:PREDICTED: BRASSINOSTEROID INSENSITIVE 1-associated receptor kinase 1-like [Fragaria vesca subsp. vesca]